MKPLRILTGVVVVAVIATLISCEPRLGPEITNLRADDPSMPPGASTVLHCEVDNPDSATLTYVWEAGDGTVENMGDSAVWTAPDNMAWASYTATVTVTVGDESGNTDTDNIDLQVAVTTQTEYANEDTYTFSYSPDSSYADGEFLRVGFDSDWGSNDAFFHTFLMFPTPVIPSGEELQGVRLRLWREYAEGEEMEIEIYLPRENWSAEGLSWDTEPDADDYAMISDNSSDVGYFYIALTSLVEDWLDNSRDNYGLMLRVSDETDYTHRYRDYGAMEGVQSKRPVLEVVSW